MKKKCETRKGKNIARRKAKQKQKKRLMSIGYSIQFVYFYGTIFFRVVSYLTTCVDLSILNYFTIFFFGFLLRFVRFSQFGLQLGVCAFVPFAHSDVYFYFDDLISVETMHGIFGFQFPVAFFCTLLLYSTFSARVVFPDNLHSNRAQYQAVDRSVFVHI